MLSLIALFPPYLIAFTIVFLFIPTLISGLVRIKLHAYLRDSAKKVRRLIEGASPGKVPFIVNKLEARFGEASSQLESINTSALIESAYSQEKFPFFSQSLSCEQWDYFTNIIPNILLAFGLLGTFAGITLNLTNISNVLQQESASGGDIFQKLQLPLQSMGIAFLTSLIALVCSSILVFINLRCNTNLSTNWLISSLEDYLDNIFHPQVDGFTRLDKAIGRMVDRQEEFLLRFHEKVGEVLESSLTPVANRIAEENEKANKIATQVYQRFLEASGTLSSSAATFRDAVDSLQCQVTKIESFSNNLQLSAIEIETGAGIFREASQQIQNSNFSGRLEETTLLLVEIEKQFTESTAILTHNLAEVIDGNKRANELAREVYDRFQETSNILARSASNFLEASNRIENSQFPDKLSNATTALVGSQAEFNRSASVLSQSVLSISGFIQEFQASVKGMINLSDRVSNLNQRSSELLELNSQQSLADSERFQQIKETLVKLIEVLQQNRTDIKGWQDNTTASISQFLERNSTQLQLIVQAIVKATDTLGNTNGNWQSQTTNLSDVIVRENSFNKEYLKYISQALHQSLVSLNKLAEVKSN